MRGTVVVGVAEVQLEDEVVKDGRCGVVQQLRDMGSGDAAQAICFYTQLQISIGAICSTSESSALLTPRRIYELSNDVRTPT